MFHVHVQIQRAVFQPEKPGLGLRSEDVFFSTKQYLKPLPKTWSVVKKGRVNNGYDKWTPVYN